MGSSAAAGRERARSDWPIISYSCWKRSSKRNYRSSYIVKEKKEREDGHRGASGTNDSYLPFCLESSSRIQQLPSLDGEKRKCCAIPIPKQEDRARIPLKKPVLVPHILVWVCLGLNKKKTVISKVVAEVLCWMRLYLMFDLILALFLLPVSLLPLSRLPLPFSLPHLPLPPLSSPYANLPDRQIRC